MKKLTEEWLKAAKDDLNVIERIIDDVHLSQRANGKPTAEDARSFYRFSSAVYEDVRTDLYQQNHQKNSENNEP